MDVIPHHSVVSYVFGKFIFIYYLCHVGIRFADLLLHHLHYCIGFSNVLTVEGILTIYRKTIFYFAMPFNTIATCCFYSIISCVIGLGPSLLNGHNPWVVGVPLMVGRLALSCIKWFPIFVQNLLLIFLVNIMHYQCLSSSWSWPSLS